MYFSTPTTMQCNRQDAWPAAASDLRGIFLANYGPGDFQSVMDARKLGSFDCARMTMTFREPGRGMREMGRLDASHYVLVLQLCGLSHFEQAGNSLSLSPGDMVLMDPSRPCRCGFDRKVTQLVLHIPKTAMEDVDLDWDLYLAKECPPSSSALLRSLLISSFEHIHPGSEHQAQAANRAVISLLVAGFRDSVPGSHSHAVDNEPVLMRSIRDFIMRHLTDETLDPLMIARANGISERQLHRLFQKTGHSICQWIRQSRLDRCAMDLRDPSQASRSITEIAHYWGFSDAAHFCRIFRKEFDQPPRAYRSYKPSAQRDC